MSYLDSLEKKGLQVESLPKGLQKKIKEYKLIEEQIVNAEQNGLSEEVETLQTGLDELNKYIERKIQIFDPEVHKRKLAVIAQMNKKNPKMVAEKVEPVVVDQKPEPEAPKMAKEVEMPQIKVQPEMLEEPEVEPEIDIPVETGLKRKPISKGKKIAFGLWGLSIFCAIMGVKMYNKK